MKPQDLLDTRDGPALDNWAQQHLDQSKAALIRVTQKSKRLTPPPASTWLGRVDRKTIPFTTSEQVRVFAQVAVDNLRQVDSILDSKLPIYSLYSMIRSAIEAASLGLWILEAKTEDVASSRTLRIYRQNIQADRTLWKTVVGQHSGDHGALSEAAREAHLRLRGVDQKAFLLAVQSTSVIQVIDAKHPSHSTGLDVFRGLEVWRLCSAVTHANQVSLLNIMETHPEGALGETVTRTSRLSFVAAAYSTALHRVCLLTDAFETRSTVRRNAPVA